jgi:integrase
MHYPKPYFRPNRQTWYVQIDGKEYTLGRDETAAWQKYHELMAARGKKQPAPQQTVRTVVSILEEFMEKEASEKAPRTYEHYRRFLKSFRLALPAGLTIDELAPGHVTDWLHQHKDWSSATKHGGIHAVKKAIKWGCKQWKLGPSPLEDVKAPTPSRRETVITPEQWPHVLGACTDQQFRDLLTFMWESGARPQEAIHVEARHYEPEGKRLVFPKEESKGKRYARVIYLTDAAAEIIERLAKQWPQGKLFRNENDLPWTRNAVRCRFRRQRIHSRVKVKVPGICSYAIRHSFATNALRAGIDPVTLAVLMGHVDTSMIANTYQHLASDPQYLRNAVIRAVNGRKAG